MMTNQKETPKTRAGGKGVGSAKGSGADFIGKLPETSVIIAQLHRHGHSVKRIGTGFVVTLTQWTRHFDNVAELRTFAKKAGAI